MLLKLLEEANSYYKHLNYKVPNYLLVNNFKPLSEDCQLKED